MDKWFETFLVVVISLVFVAIMTFSTLQAKRERSECERQGGVIQSTPLTWGADRECVKG